MWPGPRPTSLPSGIVIHPAVWPQHASDENWGWWHFGEGDLGPHLTPCGLGRGLPPYQVVSWSIQPTDMGQKLGAVPLWGGGAGSPLKLAGVPQTPEPISAVSGPKFTILWGHIWRTYCLTSFFPIVDTCLSCEDIAWQSCAMVPDGDFLHPVFSASRVQHISDLHSKFALRPHHEWKYGGHPISDR